jgi:hypothetical protein
MYVFQFSRLIYRELAPDVDVPNDQAAVVIRRRIVDACDRAMTRVAEDPDLAGLLRRTLFRDIRPFFELSEQEHVWRTISRAMAIAEQRVRQAHEQGRDLDGRELACHATTRRGTRCARRAHSGRYCPSHQHLDDTSAPHAAA